VKQRPNDVVSVLETYDGKWHLWIFCQLLANEMSIGNKNRS